tara:strand:+ start:122 stop:415 length:294 start_codon:yes stop_codon:yes gene_type:complete
MDLDKLRRRAGYVKFSIGDIIIDLMTGDVGVLLTKHRRIDMVKDDIYMWEIVWTDSVEDPLNTPNSRYMEEYGLKMSVVAGLYDWHTTRKILYTPND